MSSDLADVTIIVVEDDPNSYQATLDLLRMAGDTYLPFLAANHDAARAGAEIVAAEIGGTPYRQGVFRYQVKCLGWLREHLAGLSDAARDGIRPILAETGCLPVLEAQG